MISQDSSPSLKIRFNGMIITSILLVAALAFFAFLLVGNVGGETLYVDDDAAAGGDGSLETPFQSIQDAVDNATGGDTIRVFEGLYLENVMVNVTVNLSGNGSAQTTINASESGDVVTITSDYVNMSGFSVEGNGTISGSGILVQANFTTIFDNHCMNNIRSIHLLNANFNSIHNNSCTDNTDENGRGIRLYFSNNNTVRENYCTRNDQNGILISESEDNTIYNNTCVSNQVSGIYLSNADSNTIEKNNCSDNGFGSGIVLREGSNSNLIIGNDCSGNGESGMEIENDFNTLINNTCNDNDQHGVDLYGDNCTLTGNIFNNNGEAGIRARGDDTTITRCFTNGNTLDGIYATSIMNLLIIDSQSLNNLQNGIFIDPSSAISITNSTITGNDVGLKLDATTDVMVIDSDITANPTYDLDLTGSSDANLTNTSYAIYNVELGSTFEIWWTFQLMIKDENGTAVENAHVYLNDTNTDSVYEGFTGIDGKIPIMNVQEGTVNSGSFISLNPHDIVISKDGLETIEEPITINSHQDLEYTLDPPAEGPEAKVAHDIVIFINETQSIDFFDATPSTGSGLTFLWRFEDNSTDTSPTPPEHGPYNKAGVFIINLTVTDDQDRNDSLLIRVVVTNIAPNEADITDGDKIGLEDEELTFAATANDTLNDQGSLIFSWDFGDGTFGMGETGVTHTYFDEDVYTVILTVMDDDGAINTTQIEVTITNVLPTAIGEALNNDVTSGGTIYFNAADSFDTASDMDDDDPLDYSWNFGAGEGTGVGIVTSHQYDEPGQFKVVLTVTDDDGAFETDSFFVNIVNQPPIAIAGNDVTEFKGENITFGEFQASLDLDGSIVNYTWVMGNGDVIYNATFNYTYATVGEFIVKLTVTDNNDTSSPETEDSQLTVTIVNDLPFNLTIVASNDTIEQGMTINFTGSANDTDVLTYSWDFDDGNTTTGMNVSHTFVETGTLTVILTVSDGFDEVSTPYVIEVTNIIPNATFTPSVTEASMGEEITFTAGDAIDLDVANESLTYSWDFGDGSTATGAEVTHIYTTSGLKTVRLTVSDPSDDSDPFTVEINITNEAPTARITIDGNTTTAGVKFAFDGSASSDPTNEALTYTWDFGDDSTLVTGVIVTHTYASEGTFIVNLTVSDGTNDETTTVTMTVEKATTTGGGGGGDDGGGISIITIIALILVIILAVFLVILIMFVTDKEPKEITKVVQMFKEGKTVKDMAPQGGAEAVAIAVEGIEVEAVEVEAVVSGEALEAALVAEVEIAGEAKDGKDASGKSKREVKLIDEVDEFTAKKASYAFSLHKLERDRDLLKSDLDGEESESRKKETERQLSNIETKITKQTDRIAKLDEEAEKAKLKKVAEEKAAASGGVMVDGVLVGGDPDVFDPEAVAASVPKPESLVALEEARNAIDRVHPEKDDELARKEAELDAYAEYADDPDYADYVADLEGKIKAMKVMEKKRGDKGFPKTSEVAEANEKMKAIKKSKKPSKSDKDFVKTFTPKLQGFEKMIGTKIDELLDELYAESVEEIEMQIADEEAAWEEEKEEAVASAEEEFNARKAKAEAEKEGKAAAEAEAVEAEAVEADVVEAEAVEAEAVEAEVVEAEAVEAEAVEAEVVEAEGVEVEAEAVEAEAVEAEAVEAEAIEAEAVEVEGVEVEADEIEVEGVEIEGVEVEADEIEVEGVEIEAEEAALGKKSKKRAKTAAGAGKRKTSESKAKSGSPEVTCPQCKSRLAVGTDKRPFTFNCPKCRKQITLEAKPGEKSASAGMGGAGAPSGSTVTCPRCRSSLNVGTTQRPFTFNCPKCTQRITLQSPGKGGPPGAQGRQPYGAPQGMGQGYPQQPPSRYPGSGYGPGGAPSYPPGGPPGPSASTIRCPRCQSQLDISKMPRPSTFNCPNCSSRIEIR